MSDSAIMGLFIMSNPVFECYAFYSSILILKLIAMSFLTIIQRFKKKVFISPEDTVISKGGGEIKYDDPDIERVRRAHLNDLENIPIFLITGLLLVASNPPEMLANNLFRIYTLSTKSVPVKLCPTFVGWRQLMRMWHPLNKDE